MPPLVINRVVRITIRGDVAGHVCDNVLDFYTDENGLGEGRGDAVNNIVTEVQAQWQQHVVPVLGGSYNVLGFDWTDLGAADGQKGTKAADPALPVGGGHSGTCVPPQVSVLVQKLTSGGRGTRTGRIYLAPPHESTVDAFGRLTSAYVAEVNAGMAQFLAGTSSPDTTGGDGMVVSHSSGANAASPSASKVTSLRCETLVATQRRRIR